MGLFQKKIEPRCTYCARGRALSEDQVICDRKGAICSARTDLNEEKKAIPGLYAAGDVCGSIEEKDAKQYGMGFDAALTYGYIMGETLKKEI